MKIEKDFKLLMQLNSFIGCVAAIVLIKLGVHTYVAYAGLAVNVVCLGIWCFAEEKEDEEPKEQ